MTINKNLPNYLTILRICAIPAIIITFYFENSAFAHQLGGFLFILASMTDFLDGYIARKYDLVSNFGKIFDPIADKVLVSCTLLMLVRNGNTSAIPCLLILSREFIISGLREFLIQNKISLPVSNIAKIKTFIQMSSISLIIIGSKGSGIESLDLIGEILLWITAILTLISGYSYFKSSAKYF